MLRSDNVEFILLARGTFPIEHLVEYAPVGQSGKGIGKGQSRKLLVGQAQVRGPFFNHLDQLAFPFLSAQKAQPKHYCSRRQRDQHTHRTANHHVKYHGGRILKGNSALFPLQSPLPSRA